jgi:hypothetical protein
MHPMAQRDPSVSNPRIRGRCRLVIGGSVLALLAGCAGTYWGPTDHLNAGTETPGAVRQQPATVTGGLLTVRVHGLSPVPANLAVALRPQGTQGTGGQTLVSGSLQSDAQAAHADYFFAIELAPGSYVLDAVQIPSGATLGAAPSWQALATGLNAAFSVDKGAPRYLGRLVLRPAQPLGAKPQALVEDHYEAEVPLFAQRIAGLRDLKPPKSLLTLSAQDLRWRNVDANANAVQASGLPEQAPDTMTMAARAAYQRFLRLKLPRAFALGEGGAYGYATGANAVDRATSDCRKLVKRGGCIIAAVDNTLITQGVCAGSARPPNASLAGDPACSEQRRAAP